MDLIAFVQSPQVGSWPLLLLFLGMFVDANLIILASLFLVSQNALPPWPVAALIILGGFLEQLLWFYIGRGLGNLTFLAKWAERLSRRFDPHLQAKVFRSLLISKFIYGAHRAVIVRIGMLKVSFKNFLRSSLPATVIWLLAMGVLGMAFSASYGVLKHYFKYAELLVLGVVILVFVLDFFLSRRLKQRL